MDVDVEGNTRVLCIYFGVERGWREENLGNVDFCGWICIGISL